MKTLQRTVAVVDLVHGWRGTDEELAAAVADLLEKHGERHVALTPAEAAGIIVVAERLRVALVTTARDVAAAVLNELLVVHAAPPRLVRHGGWDWHLHVDATDDAPWDGWLASSAALALAAMLAGSTELPWGECAAIGCERVYVHDGRGHRRRYCSTRCATRERVRRHRAERSIIPSRTRPAGRAGRDATATG